MLSYVIRNGIFAPLDIMLRADEFSFHQTGVYAYDDPIEGVTTISGRPALGRSTARNDRLTT
jgi:hypothetical protein